MGDGLAVFDERMFNHIVVEVFGWHEGTCVVWGLPCADDYT
jgi:hypothetical protein